MGRDGRQVRQYALGLAFVWGGAAALAPGQTAAFAGAPAPTQAPAGAAVSGQSAPVGGARLSGEGAGGTSSSPGLDEVRRLINSGHEQEALTRLDALGKEQPGPAGLERDRGLAFYALDRLPEADTAFAAALLRDPKDVEAAQMRGLTLFRLGRPAAAIPVLEGAHGEGVQSKADPTYVLALCYVDTLRYDDARRAFAAQFGFGADSAAGYLVAARMLLRREYLPVAQQFATKALQLDGSLPLAHELLGEIALAGNHMEEALGEFEKERQRNPLEGVTFERLGDAYGRLGRYAEAARVLQQAILLEPNSTGPYILLGKVMLKQSDAVAATTFLERAERMDPANYMTHTLLVQSYRAMGRADAAAKELEIAQKIHAADEPKLKAPE